jgi:hypothetical protein
MSDEWMDDDAKWQKWSYEQKYGKGSWDRDHEIASSKASATDGFVLFDYYL